jgi:hypothetical protein
MTGTIEKNVSDTTLLMHDATEVPIVVEPGGGWPSCKSSHTTESRILMYLLSIIYIGSERVS